MYCRHRSERSWPPANAHGVRHIMTHYSSLTMRRSRELGPLLYILARAAEDPAVGRLLAGTGAGTVAPHVHTERATSSSTAIDDV